MKAICLAILLVVTWPQLAKAQEIPSSIEQQLEDIAEQQEAEPEDDGVILDAEYFLRHPVDLNTADRDLLLRLGIPALQVESLFAYRKLLGDLISIYELQAVPEWNLPMIKRLKPFIAVGTSSESISEQWTNAEQTFLLRVAQVMQKSKGFDHSTPGTKYLGTAQRIYFRCRFTYKNKLQWGLLGDKDAGEQFFRGAQRAGFDFYSAHLFLRDNGIIKALAIGDFTVNMGQGLIQWQGQAFGKSSSVMGIKRQGEVLRPYSSAGEYNFHRGAGITLQKGLWEWTVYGSLRKLTASLDRQTITSINTSGLHRTITEIGARNNITQRAGGTVLRYRWRSLQISLNSSYTHYSLPISKRDEPYNLFAIRGDQFWASGIDYSYTYRNLHVFGEWAMDQHGHTGALQGIMMSIDPRVDVSLIGRQLARDYQSLNGNAFTENTLPSNESGIFIGATVRAGGNFEINAYADLFIFPWLKYLVDAPSYGRDYLLQVSYSFHKNAELYSLFRNRVRQANYVADGSPVAELLFSPKQEWRINLNYPISKKWTVRSRLQTSWVGGDADAKTTGFLLSADLLWQPQRWPVGLTSRIAWFETDGYDSRIYSFENDVQYSYSVPALFGKGIRFYCMASVRLRKNITGWLRYGLFLYRDQQTVGSGTDEISGSRKETVEVQLRWNWRNGAGKTFTGGKKRVQAMADGR